MDKDLLKGLNPNWYSIAIINILILGIIMLFFKELPEKFKDFFIPSFIIYTLGTGIAGYIQGATFRANFNVKNFKEPLLRYRITYILWFISFISYLIYKGIL